MKDAMKKRLRNNLLIAPACTTLALAVVLYNGSHWVLTASIACLWGATIGGSIYTAILRRRRRQIEARFISDFAEELATLRAKQRAE